MKTLREYLAWAEEKQVALGHFNISDSEGFKAVVEAAQILKVPTIVGISEGEREFLGLKEAVALVKTARENGLPIFLNADHTYSVEKSRTAIDAGVDSIIIDEADKPYEENVRLTKEVVNYARAKGAGTVVEGELGFIGQSSKIMDKLPEGVSEKTQTDPQEAAKFVQETGVDLFAPSVGNIHGMIKTGNPKLNIERIKSIKKAVTVPLVLHGGSGISDDEFMKAIDAGMRIIHINTELRVAYKEGVEEGIRSGEIAPYKFLAEGVEQMKRVVHDRLKLFNKL
ncbi:MAG: Ketose-bisphosphate aldolase, class-II [Parcubacteria group bacterium GW2011_GWC1_43_30]|nr:MAG: Ketose-bisphosphate aldolase, class-II [Parcubacteria group bacterium GW2011_GWC1_43_30]